MSTPPFHAQVRDAKGHVRSGTVALRNPSTNALLALSAVDDISETITNPMPCDAYGRVACRLSAAQEIKVEALTDEDSASVNYYPVGLADLLAAIASADQAALVDNTGGSVADSTLAAIATDGIGSAHYLLTQGNTTDLATPLDISAATGGETMSGIISPDYPRSVQLGLDDADASVSALQITVSGTDPYGAAISEILSLSSVSGSKAFAAITSVTVDSVTGNNASGGADTLHLYASNDLWIPVPSTATSIAVTSAVRNGARDTVTVDQANKTVAFSSLSLHPHDIIFAYTDPAKVAVRDGLAKLAELLNALRTAMVTQGLITGAAP